VGILHKAITRRIIENECKGKDFPPANAGEAGTERIDRVSILSTQGATQGLRLLQGVFRGLQQTLNSRKFSPLSSWRNFKVQTGKTRHCLVPLHKLATQVTQALARHLKPTAPLLHFGRLHLAASKTTLPTRKSHYYHVMEKGDASQQQACRALLVAGHTKTSHHSNS